MRHLTKIITTAFLFVALTPVSAQEASDVELNIAEQPLSSSLREVADSFDLTIAFYSKSTDGLDAPALDGDFTSEAALEMLLADTNLEYTFINESSVAVRPVATEERGASDSKNSEIAPVLMAQNQTSQVQTTTTSNRSEEGGTGIVTGKVTDARTGANLKGAKVTIEETGQWNSTNDLGEFRFVNVPIGSATLTVSYLGYAGQSAVVGVRGDGISQSFALRGGSELEEIVVFGQRSARAQALNQERTAESSRTVISSDLLGDFTGTTISEALRRAPGVSFVQDSITGDGTNIIVRGLAPDLNTVTFNGVELPEGSGEGRSAGLNNILTDSIDKVTISKTLLPSQDSAGIGGLVEIETKSALDRPDRFLQLAVEGRERADDFVDDLVFSGTASARFGEAKNFGIGVSAQYRERSVRTVTYGSPNLLFGTYFPLDSEGGFNIRSPGNLPPTEMFPFVDTPGGELVFPSGLQSRDVVSDIDTLSIGANIAWDIDSNTNLRLDYQFLENTTSRVDTSYILVSGERYITRPVEELGGEERNALTLSSVDGFPVNISGNLTENAKDTSHVLSFRGESSFSDFDFSYGFGYTSGERRNPNGFRLSALLFGGSGINLEDIIDPSAIDPQEGVAISLFRPLRPNDTTIQPTFLSPDGVEFFNDPSEYATFGGLGSISQNFGENNRLSANFSSRYNLNSGPLSYIEAGIDFERSEFFSRRASASISYPFAQPIADLGIVFDTPVLAGIGEDIGLLTWSIDTVRDFYRNLDDIAASGLITVGEIEFEDSNIGVQAKETEIAPYIQIKAEIDDFEIIGGVRYSHIEIVANDLNRALYRDVTGQFDPDFEAANTTFAEESATQGRFLPRVLMNYRPTDDFVVRFGYFKSFARPQLNLISDAQAFFLSEWPDRSTGLPSLTIVEGNEDLRPASTDNYDLSFEYYDSATTTGLRASVFYKRIANLTESNTTDARDSLDEVQLPDFPTQLDIRALAASGDLLVISRIPVNNPDAANIWGIEVSAEHQFTWLDGFWKGFGVYGNYTYTDSSKNQPVDFRDPITREMSTFIIEDVRFENQPRHSGTAALTYTQYGVDTALIYSAQGRRNQLYFPQGLSNFAESYESLDFRIAYNFERWGGNYQLTFEGIDLLRSSSEPTTLIGRGEELGYYTQQSYIGGREFRLGLTATF